MWFIVVWKTTWREETKCNFQPRDQTVKPWPNGHASQCKCAKAELGGLRWVETRDKHEMREIRDKRMVVSPFEPDYHTFVSYFEVTIMACTAAFPQSGSSSSGIRVISASDILGRPPAPGRSPAGNQTRESNPGRIGDRLTCY